MNEAGISARVSRKDRARRIFDSLASKPLTEYALNVVFRVRELLDWTNSKKLRWGGNSLENDGFLRQPIPIAAPLIGDTTDRLYPQFSRLP